MNSLRLRYSLIIILKIKYRLKKKKNNNAKGTICVVKAKKNAW